MLVVYTSLTGNVRRFSQKLNHPSVQWTPELTVGEPYVFATYTIALGNVPTGVLQWNIEHHKHLKGIICSGNKNWGGNYGAAGRILSRTLGVPLLHTFELSGEPLDVEIVEAKLNDL